MKFMKEDENDNTKLSLINAYVYAPLKLFHVSDRAAGIVGILSLIGYHK